MKKTLIKFAALAALITLAFTACSKPTDNNSSKNKNQNTSVDDEITGNITTRQTWEGKDASGNALTYFINSSIYIKDGGNLTITDGAIVKFGPKGVIYVNTTGAIEATGVKFTSYRDPDGRKISIAPDENPAKGDWKQISIKDGSGKFTSCKFYYGGKEEISTLAVDGSTGKARVDQCEFRYCDGFHSVKDDARAALRYTDSVVYDAENNCVTNSVFKNNTWPLAIPSDFTIDGSNTFGLSNSEKNDYNYVHVSHKDNKVNATWAKQSVPYLYAATNNIQINSGATLEIKGSDDSNDPTVVCFATAAIKILKGGTLKLSGNIEFTNSPESSNTPFNGIFCHTIINGGSYYNYLTSNGTFIITNVKPDTSGHTAPISLTNTGA